MTEKVYIERDALIKDLNRFALPYYSALINMVIMKQSTADVVEVKHGKWKLNKDGSGTCSECGMTQKCVWDYDNWQNFCGHCGAKMDI